MTDLTPIDFQHPDAARRFAESLRHTGFGVLQNHPLQQSAVEKIYQDWQDFFRSETKHDYLFDGNRYDGFFPVEHAESAKGQKVRDLKEYFHFYLWGRCPSQLRNELASYYQNTVEFAATLLSWVETHLPENQRQNLSEPLSSMIASSDLSLLRVLHYPPLANQTKPGAIRAHAHEDINLLTILPAANEPGLQVLDKNDEWLDIPCDFGNLIVNTGDMLQEATQGYFPSTTHRVINPRAAAKNRSRISLPLFLHPRPEVILSQRFTADQYRQQRLAELRDTED